MGGMKNEEKNSSKKGKRFAEKLKEIEEVLER